jgi:TetR/AcrR family transcriptional regulator, cholesterol catabolism regulator
VGKRNVNSNVNMRETLLQLAARSFAVQGYTATTMRSIADQAKIEAASIYYHFASKEELVEAVMAQGGDSLEQHLREHLDALPPDAGAETRFKTAVQGQMSALLKFGDYALAHRRQLTELPEAARERQVKRHEENQRLWKKLLEALREEGLLRPDIDIALCRVLLLGCVNNVQDWFNPRKSSLDHVTEQICSMFFEGVKPAAKTRKTARRAGIAKSS